MHEPTIHVLPRTVLPVPPTQNFPVTFLYFFCLALFSCIDLLLSVLYLFSMGDSWFCSSVMSLDWLCF